MTKRRTAAVVATGVLIGSLLFAPVEAHITTNNPGHNWNKHYRPLATKLFFTKKQANNRFALKDHTHQGLVQRLEDLEGLPCAVGAQDGVTELSIDETGKVTLVCATDG